MHGHLIVVNCDDSIDYIWTLMFLHGQRELLPHCKLCSATANLA